MGWVGLPVVGCHGGGDGGGWRLVLPSQTARGSSPDSVDVIQKTAYRMQEGMSFVSSFVRGGSAQFKSPPSWGRSSTPGHGHGSFRRSEFRDRRRETGLPWIPVSNVCSGVLGFKFQTPALVEPSHPSPLHSLFCNLPRMLHSLAFPVLSRSLYRPSLFCTRSPPSVSLVVVK